MLRDGKKPDNFQPSGELMEAALELDLVHLLQANQEYISHNVIAEAAGKGSLAIVDWAMASGWFHYVKFFTKHSFVKNLFRIPGLVLTLPCTVV
nr:hypothetical protein Cbor_441 [Cedratvirus borely]